ncbi:MAG: SPFH domain-containing protein [Bradymonadia bacterium]
MSPWIYILLGWLAGVVSVQLWRLLRLFRHPAPGCALIITRGGATEVAFERALVWPGLHQTSTIDLTARHLRLDRRRRAALITADSCRVDIVLTCTVRVDPTREGVLAAARALGPRGVSDPEAVSELLSPVLQQALITACVESGFPELAEGPERLSARVLERVDGDLFGFRIDEIAVEHFAQSGLDQFSDEDARDAQGLTEITARLEAARTRTEALQLSGEVERARQQLEARRVLAEINAEMRAIEGPPMGAETPALTAEPEGVAGDADEGVAEAEIPDDVEADAT